MLLSVKICIDQAICTPYPTLPGLLARFTQVLSQLKNATLALHEDICPSVRQPESNQASTDKHWRGHEDGDGLGDANKRAKDQVSQDCSQLTQSIAEPKASSSGEQTGTKGSNTIKYTSIYGMKTCTNNSLPSPSDSREWLGSDHIQGIPGRDAQAVVKAQHENHHGLTGAKPQEETADAWKDHGPTWWTYKQNEIAKLSGSDIHLSNVQPNCRAWSK